LAIVAVFAETATIAIWQGLNIMQRASQEDDGDQ
jgi:hypothetical protein